MPSVASKWRPSTSSPWTLSMPLADVTPEFNRRRWELRGSCIYGFGSVRFLFKRHRHLEWSGSLPKNNTLPLSLSSPRAFPQSGSFVLGLADPFSKVKGLIMELCVGGVPERVCVELSGEREARARKRQRSKQN